MSWEPRRVAMVVYQDVQILDVTGPLEVFARATTHWRSLDWTRQSFPAVRVEDGFHMVDEGAVMTSAGISAGIDMALLVITRYFGDTVGRATARHMEYAFPDDNRRRV